MKVPRMWSALKQFGNSLIVSESFISGHWMAIKSFRHAFKCIIPNLTHGGSPVGFIENVVTDSEYRRKGIGGRVLRMAVDYARDAGCYKVDLQSGSHRFEAHALYESAGFEGESHKAFQLIL